MIQTRGFNYNLVVDGIIQTASTLSWHHVLVNGTVGVAGTRTPTKFNVLEFIDRFYNPRRRHLPLGYICPVEFESKVKLA